jgi:hypothetical protein
MNLTLLSSRSLNPVAAMTSESSPVRPSGPSASETARAQPRPTALIVLAVLYAAWLGVLAYIAWTNVQAGNQ